MDRKEPQVLTETLLRYDAYKTLERQILAGEYPIELQDAEPVFLALLAAQLSKRLKTSLLIVTPSDREAEDFSLDLEFFGADSKLLPWWKTAAYRPAAVRSKVFGDRASVLAGLCGGEKGILVASHRALVNPVPPKEYFAPKLRLLKRGSTADPGEIADLLAGYGYLRVPRIALPGEFAQRGEVIDLFMPGDQQAIRIHLDYDKIARITGFDAETQSGGKERGECLIRPLKEIIWDPSMAAALTVKAETLPGCAGRLERLGQALANEGEYQGEEAWYGLAFDRIHSILEYLDESAIILAVNRERLDAQDESLRKEFAGMYRPALREFPVPPPERCYLSFASLRENASRLVSSFALKDSLHAQRLHMGSEPPRSFFGNLRYFKEDLANFQALGIRTCIVASSEVQSERIKSLLPESNVEFFTGDLSAGFSIPGIKLRIVQEGEIFGRRKRVPKSLGQARSSVIDSFVELSPGDYVVHINYGIGRFSSIERMRVLGNERDYIKIEYADDETVFVPIEQANLVQRYIGNEGESPRLDKLGSKSWEGRKSKVRKSVEALAERLIRIYARRKTAKGFAFPPDGEWQAEFEASFPHQETLDQLRCVDEIKQDMEQPRPMDRLICGDVGYGKTEVALRACFKAMASGKQVAFLAPTTILAEQHFETFEERLRDYPVKTAMLSRLVMKKKQRQILSDLAAGSVDMVIGTHRILQKDVRFKDLGLLVIDEEQRFGVKDKERLKEMKAGIDCLTLTATPIPRTLHMSMLKIRDMSILQTPPEQRQPIQTYVEEFNPEVIARAIRSELERGGQIFYLHNRIESLPEVESFLRTLVPEALTETAHGQMNPGELEDIMHRFIHGAFHVLVSTTIIENGIDIPNVNTIIIDRADFYGISQLYQLRGRVGRSDRQAYAYLLYPDRRALSEIAMKRLQIISDFTELGSGFKIAMKDLEVRGAGNLLGREQSGDIYAVGFDLYLKLLDDAVNALSGMDMQEEEPYLELEYTGYIPDDYISMPMIKMEVYKKIASIYRQEELDGLQVELEGRFGPLPDELLSLLSLAEIRILCRRLSVSTLKERAGTVTVEFSKVSKISVERLLRLIRESHGMVRLDPKKANAIILHTKAIGLREKSEFIRERLASLA
ncbi:MAG: transcription-repair coupling factor [Spirochaetia bacterium]|jgi:transcription-repair coupling factor (superfamily II helicase)|nr:transcription-repair coupling factor [Spirochaetia bacterium]